MCQPGLQFRRLMLNSHLPWSLHYKDLLITDVETANLADLGATEVEFSAYNEEGYQATLPAGPGRAYWLHWAGPPVDFTQLRWVQVLTRLQPTLSIAAAPRLYVMAHSFLAPQAAQVRCP